MANNMALKIAFVLSLSIHLSVISFGSFLNVKKAERVKGEIEVNYTISEDVQKEFIEKPMLVIPKKYDLKKDKVKIKKRENENIAAIKPNFSEYGIFPEEKINKKETANEEYIQYYELIRQSIRRSADGYSNSGMSGTVQICFILAKNGALKELEITGEKEIECSKLKRIAALIIKNASPFPPFPESVKSSELTFQVAIVFKKNK